MDTQLIDIHHLYNNFNLSEKKFRKWIKEHYIIQGKIHWYPKAKECWFWGYKK